MQTPSLTGHLWRPRPSPSPSEQVAAPGLSRLAQQVLSSRMPATAGPSWLKPELDTILAHDPHRMTGMEAATDRLLRALRDRERIFVVTDYDVDGTTSSLILQHALHLAGGGAADLAWHIPDRFVEGYGFSIRAADKAHELGCGLVITADIGVRDHAAVTHARNLGLDVLVCDHHLPAKAAVPADASAVLCPPQDGCDYPNPALAACGVSLKVAQALLHTHPRRDRLLRSFLKLAAIGTVADVVDLSTDENRAIVALGLRELARGPHSPGLAALMRVAGLDDKRVLRASDLGFRIGPRINAAGRLERATAVVELLNERDPARAMERAQDLDRVNADRKGLQRQLEQEARRQVSSPPPPFIVVWGEEELDGQSPWHRGIAGIVAARLRDAFHRPTAVITTAGVSARGSIRSIPGFHAVHALDSAEELLEGYGGHPAAAGFSVPSKNVPALAERLQTWAATAGAGNHLPELTFDTRAQPRELSLDRYRELAELGPYGKGNPEPLLRIDGVLPSDVRTMGQQGAHLRFRIDRHRAVWWRGGAHAAALSQGDRFDLLVRLEENTYNGRTNLQLVVEDARPA